MRIGLEALFILLAAYLVVLTAILRSLPESDSPLPVRSGCPLTDGEERKTTSRSAAVRRLGSSASQQQRRQPPCTLDDVGLGRWTYEHVDRGHFKEAINATAEWTPLRCFLPRIDWRPAEVLRCFSEMKKSKFVVLGGSTSGYLMFDFRQWMRHKDANNFHSKDREGSLSVRNLEMKHYKMTTANVTAFLPFLRDEKYFENTLVLFNSGLWDMRENDLGRYERNVEDLADAFSGYKEEHPSNRVIWRTSSTPNWDKLDVKGRRQRARERLLNPDAVLTYNAVASEAMKSRGVEVFDNGLMALGRPEETRGPDDGLHPSTRLNVELMKNLFSVLCAE